MLVCQKVAKFYCAKFCWRVKMRKIMCRCPSCGGKLVEVVGSCSGVIVICPNCAASVKIDVENCGKIKINLEPSEVKKLA